MRGSAIGLLGLASLLGASANAFATVPDGFQKTVVWSGFTDPTSVAFAPDGKVFVAEKSGRIKVFDSVQDTTPTTFANLSTEVYNYWDRGLLSITVDPQFPARPYLYALYTRDALPGGDAPHWNDACPSPQPGPTDAGCLASGRLVRLTASGSTALDPPMTLITDWCQQFPSHSVADVVVGPDGALYASAGDGAAFYGPDWGQSGEPLNPCGDPPAGSGGEMTPPTAEGGSLRSQDLRSSGDPVGLDGTVVRVDPDTGEAKSDNPLAASSDANARRIVAHGFRNPFRIAFRPGTSELWVADVGMNAWEEIDRLTTPGTGPVPNFGWPCYEGKDGGVSARQTLFESLGLNLCEDLYDEGASAVKAPHFSYGHPQKIVPTEACEPGSSSIAGISFYGGGQFPDSYDDALFFADYSRGCIWAMMPGAGDLPNPADIAVFDDDAGNPVDLEVGPGGALYFVDYNGQVRRVGYSAGNHPPVAKAKATPSNGPSPLNVELDATESTDPDPGDTLTYAWDLDEDGQFDDATGAVLTREYATGTHIATVRASDTDGASDTDSVEIQAGNTPPTATITQPVAGFEWAVSEEVPFEGTATDSQPGALAFEWELIINHCPSNCHQHSIETMEGATGSFFGPNHEYPSSITLKLTVTDGGGLTASDSIQLEPRTVSISMRSEPSGMQLTLNTASGVAPFDQLTIEGSENTVAAALVQSLGGTEYSFAGWSDGGPAAHSVDGDEDKVLTATYVSLSPAPIIATPQSDPASSGGRDARPPETRITHGPRAAVPTAVSTFRFVSDEGGASFRCRIDARRWVRCSPPRSYRGLPAGAHTFRVRAVDRAGNLDPTPASRRFRASRR